MFDASSTRLSEKIVYSSTANKPAVPVIGKKLYGSC